MSTPETDQLEFEDDVPIVILPDIEELSLVEAELDEAEVTVVKLTESPIDGIRVPERVSEIAPPLAPPAQRDPSAALLSAAEYEINRELDNELEQERQAHVLFWRYLRVSFWAATFVLLPMLWLIGAPYYALSLAERTLHPFHAQLRPAGSIGLSLGIAGTVSILASLAYLVRKAYVGRRPISSLQSWLRFHVAAGTVGPIFIAFHMGFLPTSALGWLTTVSMLIIIASGLAGRFVLAWVPQRMDGGESGLEELKRRLEIYQTKLVHLGLDAELLALPVVDDSRANKRTPWFFMATLRIIIGERESRREVSRLKEAVQKLPGRCGEVKLVMILVRRLCRERQLVVRYFELRRLVGTWRFLHRWVAIVMLVGAAYHIALACRFADIWGGF